MATAACMQTLRIAPAAARPRQERGASVRARAAQDKKPAQKWVDGATVAGGGYGGSCEIEARARVARRWCAEAAQTRI
jgi:hypothetical protein